MEKELTHDEALKMVMSKLEVSKHGFITCSDDEWGLLSKDVRKAVWYLIEEWDYDVKD